MSQEKEKIYQVRINDQELGPFSLGQIKQMIFAGMIKRETMIWREEMEEWIEAGWVNEFTLFFTAMSISSSAKSFEEMWQDVIKPQANESGTDNRESAAAVNKDNSGKKSRGKLKLRVIIPVTAIILVIGTIGLSYYMINYHLNETEKRKVIKTTDAIDDIGHTDNYLSDDIEKAETLYAELNEKCRRQVKNYEDLLEAREEYDKECAEYVSTCIDAIGTVTKDSEADIGYAQEMYDLLEDQQKSLVKNAGVIEESRTAYNKLYADEVIELIKPLEEVDCESGEAINAAAEAYNALNEDQRALVTNRDILLSAPERFHIAKAQRGIELIDAIGIVTLYSDSDISAAWTYCNKLSEEELAMVENYDRIAQAEEELADLQVEDCIASIDAIGDVTLDSGSVIEEVRRKYNRIKGFRCELVTNRDILFAAENEYEKLVTKKRIDDMTMTVGETFKNNRWEITLLKQQFTNKILPDNTSGYYRYYNASNGEIYLDLTFSVRNISESSKEISNAFQDCVVDYGNSTYRKGFSIIDTSGSWCDTIYSWQTLGALSTKKLHVVITMPAECRTDDKKVTVYLKMGEEDKMFNFK